MRSSLRILSFSASMFLMVFAFQNCSNSKVTSQTLPEIHNSEIQQNLVDSDATWKPLEKHQ